MREILKCTNCGKEFSTDALYQRCDVCNETLDVVHKIKKQKKLSFNGNNLIEKYRSFMPSFSSIQGLSMGEGNTPLIESRYLSREIGIEQLFFKDESRNPTGSFKDRGTFTGIRRAIQLGIKEVGTASTGNMAASVSAYAARAGIKCHILVSKETPDEKLIPILVYQPNLIKIEGDYGKLYYESLRIGKENGIYFINGDDPYRSEGSKTISFEIIEALYPRIPDYIFVPLSSGGNILSLIKGIEELNQAGLLDKFPTIIGVQAKGCAPIYNAFKEKKMTITKIPNPNTIAHAISNPFPPSGNKLLRKLNHYPGSVIAVDDEQLLKAQKLLASREGVFSQPEGVASLAGAIMMRQQNKITPHDRIVCIITGSGLKVKEVLKGLISNIKCINMADLEKTLLNR